MKKLAWLIFALLISCNTQKPTEFSQKALNDTFISLKGKELTFQHVLNKYKNKKVFIDIWASWCADCIKGMPKVVALQKKHKDVVYLFLSLDTTQEEWKKGIKKYNVNGEHYLVTSGWKGDFGNFVNLSWIPRYMVIDENSKITLFKSVHADDDKITEVLK